MKRERPFDLLGQDFARKDAGRVLARALRSRAAPRDELGRLVRLCPKGVGVV
jgi:hypothetical protein